MATILVVDDRAADREHLVALLAFEGHRLLEAGDGRQALALMQQAQPDLLITEVVMPTMSGYELARQVRARSDTASLPVIFHTATFLGPEARALARSAGVELVLDKPAEPKAILSTVREALGRLPAGRPALDDPPPSDPVQAVTAQLAGPVNPLDTLSQKLARLIGLGLEMGAQRDPLHLLEMFCHTARQIIGARYAAVGVLADDGVTMRHFFTSGMDTSTASRIAHPPLGKGLIGKLLTDRRPYRVRAIAADPLSAGFPAGHPAMQSFLGVAIASPHFVHGVLYLTDRLGEPAFTGEDEGVVATLAAQIAVAYENARMYHDFQRHAARLQTEISEHKQADAVLRASERRFRALIEQSAEAVALIEPDGTIRYQSPAVTRVIGYAPDELIGTNVSDLIHPADQPANAGFFSRLLQGPTAAATVQLRYRHKDGLWRWVEAAATNMLAEPTVGAIVINYHDISERKQTEEIVLNIATIVSAVTGEAFFRSLVEHISTMLGADYVLVGDFPDAAQDRVRTVAVYAAGRIQQNFDYELHGKPGGDIVRDGLCLHASGLPGRYPDDGMIESLGMEGCCGVSLLDSGGHGLGLLMALYRAPIHNPDLVQSALRIFAVRASSEMERRRAERAEREQRKLAEALRDMAAALASTLSVEEILDRVLSTITRVVPYTAAHIALCEGDLLRVMRSQGYGPASGQPLPQGPSENSEGDVAGRRPPVGDSRSVTGGLGERLPSDAGPFAQGHTCLLQAFPIGAAVVHDRSPVVVPDTAADSRWVVQASLDWIRSFAVIPLARREGVLGLLCLSGHRPAQFTQTHIERLSAFADRAAQALAHAQLWAETQDALRREQQLNEITSTLSSSLNLDVILRSVVQQAAALIGADAGALGLVSPDGQYIEHAYQYNLPADLALHPTPKGQGLAWQVVLTGESVMLADYVKSPHMLPRWQQAGVRGVLDVPVFVSGKAAGMLGLFSFNPTTRFSERDRQLVEAIGRQAGIAIENARLFQETRSRAHELEALAEISAELRSARSSDEMLPLILEQSISLLNAAAGAIDIVDPATGEAVTELALGDWAGRTGVRVPPGGGIAGRVIGTGRPYQTDDLAHDPFFYSIAAGGGPGDSTHAICAPLMAQEQAIGALWAGRHARFDEGALRLLVAIADIAANAIRRASLHDQTRQRAEQLAQVNTLSRALGETLELEQVCQKLGQATRQLLPQGRDVLLWLFNPARTVIACVHAESQGGPIESASIRPVSLSPQDGNWRRQAVYPPQPLIIAGPPEAAPVQAEHAALDGTHETPPLSGLLVPMVIQGSAIGLVEITGDSARCFDQDDADLLMLVANTAAVAVENARLFAAVRRRSERMQALHSIDLAITNNLDLDSTLDELLGQTVERLGIHAGDVLLLDPVTQTLRYGARRGYLAETAEPAGLPLSESLAGRAAGERSVVAVPDLSALDGSLRAAQFAGEGFVAYYGLPLIAKERVVGVLEIFHRAPLDPDPEWIDFLQALAAQAAIAVENAALFSDLQQSIEELRTTQGGLIQAARLSAVGELAAGVAHQINNPLTTIIADAQLLTRSVSADHPAHASAAAIFQAGWRAQSVVKRLLNFARPDEGELKLTAVNDTILEALELIGAHLGRGGATVDVRLAAGLPPIIANGHQLQEVWLNLLMNARDALVPSRPGIIELVSRLPDAQDSVEISITDNGRGIAEADRPNVFTLFFTTKGENRGNGLGLSVCQRIVRNHGGQIWFDSQEEQGTKFTVSLPRRPASA